MNRFALSRRDRRTAVVGLVALATLWGAKGASSWREWRENAADAAVESRSLLDARRAALASLPALMDSVQQHITAFGGMAEHFIAIGLPPDGERAMRRYVEQAARGSGFQTDSISVENQSAGALIKVTAHVSGRADIVSLTALLTRIERGAIPASVEHLLVTPENAAVSDGEMEVLHVHLKVSALVFPTSAGVDDV